MKTKLTRKPQWSFRALRTSTECIPAPSLDDAPRTTIPCHYKREKFQSISFSKQSKSNRCLTPKSDLQRMKFCEEGGYLLFLSDWWPNSSCIYLFSVFQWSPKSEEFRKKKTYFQTLQKVNHLKTPARAFLSCGRLERERRRRVDEKVLVQHSLGRKTRNFSADTNSQIVNGPCQHQVEWKVKTRKVRVAPTGVNAKVTSRAQIPSDRRVPN